MSSSKRDRRSRSGSHSSDAIQSKPKRTLDLVTTRNLTPPRWHPRGRGRPMRRPFVYRGHRGMTFRGSSQRFYPRKRFDSREDAYNRHRRSRSRSGGHSRGRSGSRDRHRRSRSKSSESESGSRHRSKNQERRHSDWKDGKHNRSRDAMSPDSKSASAKKKRRHSSPSPDRRQQSQKARSSRSHSKERSPSRSQHPSATSLQSRTSRHDEDVFAPSFRQGNRFQEEEGKFTQGERQRDKPRSKSPEVARDKRPSASTSVPGPTKGKELIPRNRLHKIFTLISQDGQFELEEDISIAIQRNPYAEPSEDSTVTVVFDPELFAMIYPYEGRKHKPIFDREEIKVFGHDKNLADDPDFERRVIRLKPGKSSQQADTSYLQSSSYQHSASLEITRTVKRDRSRSSSMSRSDSGSNAPTRHREPKFRLRVSTDPRFEARYAKLQGQDEVVRSRRSNLDPSDLRHELSSHRNTSSDARDRDRRDDRPRSSDAREARQDQNKDKEELPDYSRRKDKHLDLPWLYDPESIPKDPKYFMHDDREGQDPRDRGRGRGRFFRGRFNSRRPFRPFRGRGGFRGSYFRGKGNYSGSDPRSASPRRSYSGQRRDYDKSPEREWKHDKFTELEREGEKKSHGDDERHEFPHSTSER